MSRWGPPRSGGRNVALLDALLWDDGAIMLWDDGSTVLWDDQS